MLHQALGVYAQDEWKLATNLTLNYGFRLPMNSMPTSTNEGQISPRANLVWQINKTTTAHAGYSRFFDPPPVQYVGPSTIAKFVNTTNASSNSIDDPPKVERSNYYDVGISRQIAKPWVVNLDGYFKEAHNLVDLGQFGQAVILSPFNYQDGYDYGQVKSAPPTAITGSPSSATSPTFRPAAAISTRNKFLIDNAELAFIQNHFIKASITIPPGPHPAAFPTRSRQTI